MYVIEIDGKYLIKIIFSKTLSLTRSISIATKMNREKAEEKRIELGFLGYSGFIVHSETGETR